MFSSSSNCARLIAAGLAAVALAFLHPAAPQGLSSTVVISQVYGGGGNAGATYTHDFIELFNRGAAPVAVDGWSVQYASASGTSWQVTPLSGTIAPGGYLLVRQAQGAGGTTALPTPDVIGGIAMSATAGKVVLASVSTALTGACPAGSMIVDTVGFGGASCSETAPTVALSNTTAAIRNANGCDETDNNASDFTVAPPSPRNSASAPAPCGGAPSLSIDDVSVAEGDSGTTVASFTVSLSAPSSSAVTFDVSTEDGTATIADADYTAASVSASIPAGQQTYTFDVAVNGDATIEPHETFFVNLSAVSGAANGRIRGTGTITNDDVAPVVFDVVISQVYGGGGNSGATYTHDFIELFNRGSAPVSIDGWSVQYTSAGGATPWQATPLSGTIQPGKYYLVQQAAGAGGTTPLPSPDASGNVAMASAAGRVLLRSTTSPFTVACPADATIVDLVGFGTAACFEGAAAAPPPSNTLSILRKRGGCFDSNDNQQDFTTGSAAPRNSAAAMRACSYTTTSIHAIQGNGAASPFAGQDVTTSGIVTALRSNGFFMQTATDEDGDPATSQALFVFTGTAPAAAAGDMVRVKGTASEFFGLTQIEASLPGDVTVESPGHMPPAAVPITATDLASDAPPDALERLEGMRVQTGALVSVAPTDGFGEINAVLSGVPRPMREPGIERRLPIPPAAEGGTDCCVPTWDMNPERIVIDSDGLQGMVRLDVTSNVTIAGVVGPLDYSFGRYKILPETAPAVSASMSAVAVPVPTPAEFTVGSFNIENFNNDDTQRRKAALHVRTIMQSPDVVGVVEIATLPALQALATQINSDAVAAGEADPQYEAALVPTGTGTQNVGFLTKRSRVLVHQVAQHLAGQTFINPATGQSEPLHDRPPLVLDATVAAATSSPARVIVVVNHLRSFIDIERLDGEGVRVRAKRTAQAEAVAQLLDDLQDATPGALVIAVGDYNAYEFSDGYTDPVSVLKGQPTPGDRIVVAGSPDLVDPDFVNLTDRLPADQRYTFIFEGTPQAIDHVLVNPTAARYVQRYAIARSNADFPETASLQLDPSRPERNSDHDSPVAYFAFPGEPVIQLTGGATIQVEAFTSFTDPGATAHDDQGPLPVSVSGTVDVNVPGTYVLTYTTSNAHTQTSVTRTVIVADTVAPAITRFRLTPDRIPAFAHLMLPVLATYGVTDASGSASCALEVTSNEPVNGQGDGNTNVDWFVAGPHLVFVRAERSGRGTGRIYTVTLTCVDPSGNAGIARGTVTIPK